MKFTLTLSIAAFGIGIVSGASPSLRGPFDDQALSAIALGGHNKQECRDSCMDRYCPDDIEACKEKCKSCCNPNFTCDDSDFPDSGGEDRGERCFLGDDMCANGLFCKVGDYSCSEEANPSGRCRVFEPNAPCPMNIAKVCGCDGRTYDNACLAYAAGVNVAKNDECELPGNGGEKCRFDDISFCTEGLYCKVGNYACGEESNPEGRCAPKPEACTYQIQEVCGCDGRTYSNPCQAHSAGVNIKKSEPCHANSKLGDQCFFDDDGFCGDGLFCKINDYYCKYEANPAGKCRKEPADTACTMEYAPVCGCDCNTYSNKCQAHAAGVNIYANTACSGSCDFPKEEGLLSN